MTPTHTQQTPFVGTLTDFAVRDRRVALVVIDMIKASADEGTGWARMYRQMGLDSIPDHYLGRLGNVAVPHIKRLLEAFRSTGWPVIYTTLASEREDYGDLTPRTRRQIRDWLAQGYAHPYPRLWEDGASIIADLAPGPRDIVVNKTRLSAFHGSSFPDRLREIGVEALVFTGMATNYCVMATLLDAYDHGFDCLLVEDATATLTEAMQSGAIDFVAPFARVATTDALLDEIGGPRAPA